MMPCCTCCVHAVGASHLSRSGTGSDADLLQVDAGKALIAKAKSEAEQARKHRAELQESCTNVLVSADLVHSHSHHGPIHPEQ